MNASNRPDTEPAASDVPASNAGSPTLSRAWRPVLGRLRVRFTTSDVSEGIALLEAVGPALGASGLDPRITLTPSGVVRDLDHDAGTGVPQDVLELTRAVDARAAELGLTAQPHALTAVELGLDTEDGARLSPFYAALFDAPGVGGESADPTGQSPFVWWQEPDPDGGPDPFPAPDVPQRWHLDVWVAPDAAQGRLDAVLTAGGRLVSDAEAPAFWVIEDPDGNRSCICTDEGR